MRIECCSVCKQPGQSAVALGRVDTETFRVRFRRGVCLKCAELLFMVFDEIVDQMTGDVDVNYDDLTDRLHRVGMPLEPRLGSPEVMVEEFLRGISGVRT